MNVLLYHIAKYKALNILCIEGIRVGATSETRALPLLGWNKKKIANLMKLGLKVVNMQDLASIYLMATIDRKTLIQTFFTQISFLLASSMLSTSKNNYCYV